MSFNRFFASILLFFCLAAPLVVSFSYLHVQKAQVRKEVKRQIIAEIDQTELVLLQFSIAEAQTLLHWKHDGEFEFQGQMYDVVKKEISTDSISFWCWWDHEETKLYKQLEGLLAKTFGNSPLKKSQEKKLVEFYKNLYCSEFQIQIYMLESVKPPLLSFEKHYHSPFQSPPAPPPRFS